MNLIVFTFPVNPVAQSVMNTQFINNKSHFHHVSDIQPGLLRCEIFCFVQSRVAAGKLIRKIHVQTISCLSYQNLRK